MGRYLIENWVTREFECDLTSSLPTQYCINSCSCHCNLLQTLWICFWSTTLCILDL